MKIFKFDKNHLTSFVISLIIFTFISILFSQTNLFEGLEWGAEDFRFFLRDTSQADITLEKGISFSEMSDGTVNVTELVAKLINQGKTLIDGIENVFNVIEGSSSILLLNRDRRCNLLRKFNYLNFNIEVLAVSYYF